MASRDREGAIEAAEERGHAFVFGRFVAVAVQEHDVDVDVVVDVVVVVDVDVDVDVDGGGDVNGPRVVGVVSSAVA